MSIFTSRRDHRKHRTKGHVPDVVEIRHCPAGTDEVKKEDIKLTNVSGSGKRQQGLACRLEPLQVVPAKPVAGVVWGTELQ